MTSKNRNLSIAAGAVAILLLLVLQMSPSAVTKRSTEPLASQQVDSATTPEPQPETVPLSTPTSEEASFDRTYALGLHEIRGLNEATLPGTRIDIWVAWGPPVAKRPDVARLLKDVTVVELQPPLLPEGPVTVVLGLGAEQVKPLAWGIQYGRLIAVSIG